MNMDAPFLSRKEEQPKPTFAQYGGSHTCDFSGVRQIESAQKDSWKMKRLEHVGMDGPVPPMPVSLQAAQRGVPQGCAMQIASQQYWDTYHVS